MSNRRFRLFLLLFFLLFMGCAQQSTAKVFQEKSLDFNEDYKEPAHEQVNERAKETVSATETNGVLTLGQVLALTLMNNPELKVFSLETRASEARELQAGLWPNPELGVEVENVGGTGGLSRFRGAETTIQLSQLIELGDKSQKRKRVASFEKELASLDYQNKRLEIFSEVAKAFILVLKAQEELQLSNELLDLSEKSFAIVEKRVDAGKDSPVEKTRASVALSNFKILHRETERNLGYSRKQLAFFWDQDSPAFQQAAGNLDIVGQLPELEELTNQLKSTPEYARLRAEISRSQAVLDLEKSNAVSDVTFDVGVRRFNDTDDNAILFGFSIPLPISNRNQGAKQEAIYNLAKSRQEQKVAWLKLQGELNQAYQEFSNSYSRSISLKNEVLPGVVEMFAAATRAYEEGKVDYLNVLDAQRTLFEAKSEYFESLAAYHIAKTDIERFVGSHTQTINISESGE